MEKVLLEARKRSNEKKSSNKSLRREGKVPGVIYSKNVQPISIEVNEGSINPLVFTSKTNLISLNIEGENKLDCIIKDIQFDPVTDKIVHFDLQEFNVKEKIQIEVPIQLVGSAIGVKEGGIVQQNLHKVDLECLPSDIPESVTIDISNLKLGDSVHVSDLKLDGVEFLNPDESIIVSVAHPKVDKEPLAEEASDGESTEPEVIGKGKSEEKEEE
ncbi:MAG TPA: 50S ribosomal protein L25 [Ignavibacteriaceae bacterium]|nr:50S ribosomal protein L25 [Ignavibacteriaceae bacterium]